VVQPGEETTARDRGLTPETSFPPVARLASDGPGEGTRIKNAKAPLG